jgi:HlyD family secretion protein
VDKVIKKTWIQKNKKYLLLIVPILVILIFGTSYATMSKKTVRVEKENISFFTVKDGDFEEYINVSGIVHPKKTIQLVALEGGIVEHINVEDGDFIEIETEILKLSNQSLQLDLMDKETALLDQLNNLRVSRMSIDQNYSRGYQQFLNLEVRLAKAKREFLLNKELITKEYVSQNSYQESSELYYSLIKQLDIAKETLTNDSLFLFSQIKQLNFSMNLIQENLELVKNTMMNLSIVSSYAGQLSNFDFELGQNIKRGEKIGEIDLKQGYLIKAQIDEHYISRVQKGLMGDFTFNGKTYKLIVKKIFPKVTNGMFEVDLLAKDPLPSDIKLGQSSYVKLSLGKPKKSLLLRKGPFFQSTGGNWVFVLNENGEGEKRNITVGKHNPSYYEILTGLKEGEEVIISDYANLGDAELIKFK